MDIYNANRTLPKFNQVFNFLFTEHNISDINDTFFFQQTLKKNLE